MSDQTSAPGVIGSDSQRFDGEDKVRGEPLYGADRVLPRMAYARTVTANIGKGRIRRLDTSRAEAVPGVVLVLTHLNMDRLKPIGFLFAGGHAQQSFQLLQSDAVAYRGQAIALIVAENLEAADSARSAIEVDYEPASFSVEIDAPQGEEVKQSAALPWFPDHIAGEAEKALRAAPVTLEVTYTAPANHANAIELLSCVARWEGDQLIVQEGSQSSQAMRQGLAIQLGIDPEKVRVMAPYAGGGFGHRNSLLPHAVLAAVAARRIGRPVKVLLSRDQVFHGASFRAATRHHIRLGSDSAGKLIACTHDIRAQTSRFDLMPFTGDESTARIYGIPNFKSSVTLVRLDTQSPGFLRPPFEMSSFVALEGALDELAYKVGRDPVQLRIANDTQRDPISGKPYTLRRLVECLQRGAAQFGWERRLPEPMSMRGADGTLIGWGVAAAAYPMITAPTLATVRLNANETVEVLVGGHEMGQGIRTAIALVAAETLGVEPSRVRLTIGDTIAPPQHLTAGSWGTSTATPAVQEAARGVCAQLIELASARTGSPLHSVAPADLTFRDGRIQSKDGRVVRYGELLERGGLRQLEAHGQWFARGEKPEVLERAKQGFVTITGGEYRDFVAFSYAAHFVEVHINPRIPRPRVVRTVSVIDCGRVISRRTARSQVYGGIVWGVGAAFTEESEVDPRFGGFLNNNIAEYQVPVNADIGVCSVDFIDEPDFQVNPLGVKGLGEISSAGSAAAMVNAVFHATGKRVRNLPVRIENLI